MDEWALQRISASVQQELLPRMSVEVGYFRRWLQNFLVTDNLSVLASDFDGFSVTAHISAVPEPSSVFLVAVGGLLAVRSRGVRGGRLEG